MSTELFARSAGRWLALICVTGFGACRPSGPEPVQPQPQPPLPFDVHGLQPHETVDVEAVFEYFRQHGELPRVPYTLLDRLRCQRALQDREEPLESRLGECLRLRNNIVWETPTGEKVPYPFWTPEQKRRLDELLDGITRNVPDLGIACPDLATRGYSQRIPTEVYLTARQAFDIYAAHVAHALHLEGTGGVPWSLYSLPVPELLELLSSDRYHSRILPSDLTAAYYPPDIVPERDFQLTFSAQMVNGRAVACDPRVGYWFAAGDSSTTGEYMIESTEEETLARLSQWMAENVVHSTRAQDLGLAGMYRENRVRYGFLVDRLKAHDWEPDTEMIIAPVGCHFATNLLHDLARALNLPLLRIKIRHGDSRPHQGLAFRWARSGTRLLTHTDDLYANALSPSFPLRDDGTVPSPEDARRIIFETLWRLPDLSWGFHPTRDYTLVPPDPSSRDKDDPNTGVYAGYFEGFNDYRAYLIEQRYVLGSWHEYLSLYCDFRAQFLSNMNPALFRPARARSAEMHRAHAAATVAAYGGCDAMRRQYDEFVNVVRGSNPWRE